MRRAIVGGAFGKLYIRKAGKLRQGYYVIKNLASATSQTLAQPAPDALAGS
jgi:hypothetical protein